MSEPDIEVVDNPEEHRYEAHARDGSVLGFAAYQRAHELVVLTHTEVDAAQEGKGVGSTLVRGALDGVRDAGLEVLPLCPFVKKYIARHEEYADLVYGPRPSTAKD
jgi:predicted GNAT family acetyltransferase